MQLLAQTPVEEVQAYLDELLCDASLPTRKSAAAAPASVNEASYLLVRAAGMRLALPALQVRAACAGDGPRTLDVGALIGGRLLCGHPITGETMRPGVVVTGFPEWILAVDELEGVETISTESIDWREKRGSRSWLAGMARTLQVAILVPGELIAEAQRHGI